MTSVPVDDDWKKDNYAQVSKNSDADLKDIDIHFAKEGQARLSEFRDTNYIVVAAVDFGSTFSGYGFSTRLQYKSKPQDVNSMTWTAGSGALQSLKTASCILFKPNKTFDSFGFEAEDKYANLVDNDKHKDWYYFRRFKMKLYEQKIIDWKTTLTTEDNKTMSAMTVFSEAIKFLKNHLIGQCKKQGLDFIGSDIRWVLTVPAIWDDAAKQFMRKAAELADIPGHQLYLSLEAEAAALYCKYLPVDEMAKGRRGYTSVFKPESRYLVLDVGGGTVDLTVHEVQDDLTLKEVHMATGGDWGGTLVDAQFESVLAEIVGDEVYEAFKHENLSDYFELLRTFEVKKRTLKPHTSSKSSFITFSVPISLTLTFDRLHPDKNLLERIKQNSKLNSKVSLKADKLRMENEFAISLFDKSLKCIQKHLETVLAHPEVKDISAILMVGGYSECPLLQSMVENNFPDKRLIVPNEAGLAVLKGAVINGHEPDAVTERICRYSYGIAMVSKFQKGEHEENYRFCVGDKEYCDNIFSKHLTKGQRVPLFVPGDASRYMVINPKQRYLLVEVFISTDPNPKYVLDSCCKKLGSVVIDVLNTSKGINRGVDVTMTLGGAEVEVKAIDIHTQDRRFAYYDFIGSPTDEEKLDLFGQTRL